MVLLEALVLTLTSLPLVAYDLGIMDNIVATVLIDVLEVPIASVIVFANIVSINIHFLIPGIVNIIFIVVFFIYCKKVILAMKQLDLKLKSRLFSMVGEMISGLIQIKIFKRRLYLLQEFAKKIN